LPAAAQRDSAAIPVATFVVNALRYNTDLRAAALVPRLAGADLLAARGVFDPSLIMTSDRGNKANDVLGVSPRSTQTSLTSAATLGATLPVGSQLSMTLRNSRFNSDPYFISTSTPYPTSNAASLSFSFIQPLLRGFGREGTYGVVDAASYSADAAQSRYERSADIVVATVERAYWTLQQAEANESVLRRSVEASRAIYQRNVALKDRDVATALDVLTSERGLATRETQLWEATRQRIDAAERLLFLAYGEQERDAAELRAAVIRSVLDSLATPTVPSVAESVKLALAQRSDGIAARREVEASAKRSAQARSQRLPRLDLIASYGYGGTSSASRFLTYGDSTDVRSSSWTLGLSASVFGRNDAASAADQRAEAAFESARVAGSAVDNAIVSDVRAGSCAEHGARPLPSGARCGSAGGAGVCGRTGGRASGTDHDLPAPPVRGSAFAGAVARCAGTVCAPGCRNAVPAGGRISAVELWRRGPATLKTFPNVYSGIVTHVAARRGCTSYHSRALTVRTATGSIDFPSKSRGKDHDRADEVAELAGN
jgi:outer membrane protein TolC